ncbi:hypothetical protein BMR02_13395 [Methylococcaceae bacterium HT1]|uniref:hypothetical protein n=1 Tax=Bathymodiolus japonicus methanotrophic gill symbiont TaxID=113269 RepID=UPI0011C7E0C9|nr:hypothetical protein [Bathymodiolus japonicus methanotrophic gill symbiont]TXK94950.1 hypothetical protein BMR02_13395 [Methylococcaceae bacterium HT1]TXL17033.1 hypothetical protein BMR06_15265 [Methylococcaceae bacterium HT5]GFO73457.1 hypothetical protein BJAS_P4269 [Bathymodiolus japonicus methanotrophic gill symbiont]
MSDYSLVLSDDLLQLFLNFKNGKVNNPNLVEKFLNYYHVPHLTCVNQLKRIGNEDTALLQLLASQGYIAQSLEDLVTKTRYKLILNTEKYDYPYVNIDQDKVEKNFTLTFGIGENRDKAIQLITALCLDAKFILIFDRYFCDRWNNTKNLFQKVIPHKNITLLHDDHLTNKTSEIKKINRTWTIKCDKKKTFINAHDRYLLIDNKIEIILSSGFDNLFSTNKDLTCVIRYKS